jgi:hypothetical protein
MRVRASEAPLVLQCSRAEQLEGPGADLQWQGHLLWGRQAMPLALRTVLVLPH